MSDAESNVLVGESATMGVEHSDLAACGGLFGSADRLIRGSIDANWLSMPEAVAGLNAERLESRTLLMTASHVS